MKPEQIVYFMKPVGMAGPIKIGCTKWAQDRLVNLSIWSPFPLEIIVTIPGTFKLERNLHCCFADLHSHREWFFAGERLLSMIEKLKCGLPIGEAVNLKDRRGSITHGGPGKRPAKPGQEGLRGYESRLRHAAKRADKLCGERRFIPKQANDILERWRAIGGAIGKPEGRRPTHEEFIFLDAVIAKPEVHTVPSHVRFPKPSAKLQENAA